MAISIENIEVIVSVVDQFSDELQQLSAQLVEVGTLAESVDDITIDVSVRGDEAAMGKLSALGAQARAVDGGVSVPDGGGRSDGGVPTGGVIPPNQRLRDLWGFGGRQTPEAAFEMPDLFEGRREGRRSIFGRLGRMLSNAGEGEGLLGDFNLRMETFHNLLASMLPMLITLIAALPAAATALVTLAGAAIGAAAALGGVAALGVMGLAAQRGDGDIMSGLQDIWQELRDAFLDSFMPVARAFDDLAADALNGLKRLFDEIAARADALVALKDEARALGSFLLDVIPVAVERLAQLTEAFAPVLAAIGEWLASSNLLERWVDITARALPHLWGIAAALSSILPAIIDLSLGFLRAAEMMFHFLGILSELLGIVPGLREGLGAFFGALLLGVSAASLLSKTLAGLNWLMSVPMLQSFAQWVTGMSSVSWSSLMAMSAVQALTAAVRALLATTGIGLLIWGVGELTNQFLSASGAIGDATSSLQEFGRVSNRVSGTSIDSPAAARSGVERGGQTTVNYTRNTTVEGASDPERTSRELDKQRFKDSEFSPY